MNMEPLYKIRKSVFDPLAWYLSKRELRHWMQHREIDTLFSATEKYSGRGYYASIHAIQVRSEIVELARLVQQHKPRTIVEIGTAKGGTLFLWCRSNPQAELVVSIDLPGGMYGGGYDERRARLYKEFLSDRPNTDIRMLRSDSHEPATLARLDEILAGRSIDFLYIDGDHSYEGVMRDYQMYSPLVSKGGLIAFHDINTLVEGHEVYKFWNDIKPQHRHLEIVENPARGKYGLGVLYID